MPSKSSNGYSKEPQWPPEVGVVATNGHGKDLQEPLIVKAGRVTGPRLWAQQARAAAWQEGARSLPALRSAR